MSLSTIVLIAILPIASVLPLQLSNLNTQFLELTVPSDPNDIPAGWTFVGCFSDSNFQIRTLSQAQAPDSQAMTPLLCTEFCSGSPGPFNFAGTEFSEQCFCGLDIQPTAELLPNSSCNFPCAGDANLMCGGPDIISVYQNLNLTFVPPTNKPVVNDWTFGGCFVDNPASRSLAVSVCMSEEVNVEGCTATCQEVGFTIAGLEFGSECWCGNSFLVPTAAAPVTDCDMPCDGDDTEFCGGPDRLTIYTLTS